MAIFDLFSKRQKKLRGDVPDVYLYDKLPQELRTQIIHIWLDTLGRGDQYYEGKVCQAYPLIVDTLCREYGLFKLPGAKDYGGRDYIQELANFFLREEKIERALDAVELSFRVIDHATRNWDYLRRRDANEIAHAAIEELNGRFKEHGVGYQFAGGEIIRIDSELASRRVGKAQRAHAVLGFGRYTD